MQRRMLKSKIHRATVTAADLSYVGSISIDPRLMEAADILEHEQVTVLDVDNGARFETYAIRGEAGEVCLNGAAARLVQVGDTVILLTYGEYEEHELVAHRPRVVHVDEKKHRRRRRLAVDRLPRAVSSTRPPARDRPVQLTLSGAEAAFTSANPSSEAESVTTTFSAPAAPAGTLKEPLILGGVSLGALYTAGAMVTVLAAANPFVPLVTLTRRVDGALPPPRRASSDVSVDSHQ